MVSGHHDHHQRVPEQSEDDDDAEEHGDDDADYLLHDAELRLHSVGYGAGGVARLAEGREDFTVVGRQVGTLSVADSLGRRAAPAPAHRDGRRGAQLGRVARDARMPLTDDAADRDAAAARARPSNLPHRSALLVTLYLIIHLHLSHD